ncbi:MAG: N-6 DNA methylase [Planctomycetaceae bacterium]|nr:N-6 DNA methylase [Planctomycetaceae bacterium]
MDALLATIRSIIDTHRAANARRAALGESLRVVCRRLATYREIPFNTEPQLPAESVARIEQQVAELVERNTDWLANPADALGELYQRLLADSRASRRSAACYYTPLALVEQLLDASLAPLLAQLADQPDREAALLRLNVCDPACGNGRFLVAAARRLAAQLQQWRGTMGDQTTLDDVLTHCIYGIDRDPLAVELARFALQWLTPAPLTTHVHVGDSLREFPRSRTRQSSGGCHVEPRPNSGEFGYSEQPASTAYDLIIGNPPFVNMIDGGLSNDEKRSLTRGARGLTGTADLAYHFVARAHELTRPDGRIAFILPKSFLNAPSASGLRSTLAVERPPSSIVVPDEERQFRGASTYICALVLGGEQPCHSVVGSQSRTFTWPTPLADPQQNWWRIISTTLAQPTSRTSSPSATLGEQFTITAGMTTGEAYQIREHLHDDPAVDTLRLITSRLIDPDACRWGQVACRYLGQTYTHPTLVAHPSFPHSLQRRLDASRRPKLLVAGLANRLEAYVDEMGRDLGAVSTWTIFHPHDDLVALRQLCTWLHSSPIHDWLRAELGAASVGHGYMTITKHALRRLPLSLSSHGIAA